MDPELDDVLLNAVHKQVEAEQQLSRRLEEYVGKWVAVKNHEIVAEAGTLDDLLSIIEPQNVEAFFEVQPQGAACFF